MILLKLMIILLSFIIVVLSSLFKDEELIKLRDETKDMFLHAYHSYIHYGLPFDEVFPISCKPRSYKHRIRGDLDDVLGNYYLTLVDSLDSLVLLREEDEFFKAIEILKNKLTFNTDIDVSVFETNIRILGGLLSAHQLCILLSKNSIYKFKYDDNFLLQKSKDLANRLLPAFQTKTGIPIHRINLKYGIRLNETTTNCPAAAGSFIMEFGLLSRLLNDKKYENIAFKATKGIFDRRSKIDLIGSLIDVTNGNWIFTHSSIGAGFDSYFEYLIKGYALLGDQRLLKMFDITYNAIQKNLFLNNNTYIEVDMNKGNPYSFFISSLSAFFPTVQVLYGKVFDAKINFRTWERYYQKYDGLPDIYDIGNDRFLEFGKGYYNRPEMIESAYNLYMATRDDKYLSFALSFLQNVNKTKSKCGFASYTDISLKSANFDDRMDSFVISETLKYLYLIFDEAIKVYKLRKSFFCAPSNIYNFSNVSCVSKESTIFTTEGHLFIIPGEKSNLSLKTCPA